MWREWLLEEYKYLHGYYYNSKSMDFTQRELVVQGFGFECRLVSRVVFRQVRCLLFLGLKRRHVGWHACKHARNLFLYVLLMIFFGTIKVRCGFDGNVLSQSASFFARLVRPRLFVGVYDKRWPIDIVSWQSEDWSVYERQRKCRAIANTRFAWDQR